MNFVGFSLCITSLPVFVLATGGQGEKPGTFPHKCLLPQNESSEKILVKEFGMGPSKELYADSTQ
ncbi:hypothetical protein ERO13_D09G038750v2 [Gossypium hirsutum]|uniref:Uncharacterized protein n=1 Tax=Gossypium darwinii TaxID=34276 RepID=A0A5D2B5Q1_GOSDA|nr:hypothetical protein ERO13_D09G038750v2 [Gossypium hirsutum]TYG52707.1 hypothetical protein ES288_D09G050300v1 [Gossypium darwinii]